MSDHMVSWGRAFRGAAGMIGFSIIWWIVGGILVGAGLFLSGFGLTILPSSASTSFFTAIIGFILIVAGALIGTLGTAAATLKILSEIVAEEVKGI